MTLSIFRSQVSHRTDAINVEVPSMGDSITEGSINCWKKELGEIVDEDDVVAVIDTDKVSVDVIAPRSGRITKIFAGEGETVEVGADMFVIDTDVDAVVEERAPVEKKENVRVDGDRIERVLPMSRMRRTIGDRLKKSQNDGVCLTTFQECDMSKLMAFVKKMRPEVQSKHNTKLGFMSFFMAACSQTLLKYPGLNSEIEGTDYLDRNFVDISCAVATPTGLAVPVVKNVHKKSLVNIENDIKALATKARDGTLSAEDMVGGTFTISNGGVYGSMMGTPVINPPQAAILGMHGIAQRAVVRDGQVVARPIMYLGLTYDHRIVDGKDSVCFLKEVAELIESPEKILALNPLA